MAEEERLNPEMIAGSEQVQRLNWRSSSYLSATYLPKDGISWTSVVYLQPRVDAFADYRLVAETGLALSLNKRFAFTFDARYRQDSSPPQTPEGSAEVLDTDVSIKNGIKVSW